MSDVFISYAHEDQAFARTLAHALEQEGLAVWWDHTIPPGKTWNEFIARGIEDAKACIVLWSRSSVASKWVLEEASLAGDAGKLLPVSVDGAPPPMGFRSMQAAQLQGWNGERSNAQFQLLAREARALIGGTAHSAPIRTTSRPISSAPPAYSAAQPSAAPGKPPWGLIGGVGAGVVIVVLLALLLFRGGPQEEASEPAAVDYAATATEPATDPAAAPSDPAATPADTIDPAELERLRRERDRALEAARNQEQENQRLLRESAKASAPASSSGSYQLSSFLGVWSLARRDRDDDLSPCSSRVRLRTEGSNVIWDYVPQGGSDLSPNLTGTTHRIEGSTLRFNNSDLYWARLGGGGSELTMNQGSNTCTYRRQ